MTTISPASFIRTSVVARLPVAVERRVAAWDRRRIDQGGRRLPVGEEAVEDRAELVNRAQVHLEEEAILTRDPVALAHLANFLRELRNPRQLTWGGLDAHDCRQLVAEGAGIDLGAVAGDHTGSLETLNPLGHSRRGEVDPSAQLGDRDAAVPCQLADDLTVGRVDLPKIVGVRAQASVLSKIDPP
jgi:hypothetical protein